MIVHDLEIFRYDWMIVWLDCKTRKVHSIVNDKEKLEKFYEYYKNEIWVGYNSRNYDVWITKAILCGFNPYDMSDWIINKDRKGFEFSKLLMKFPIINYDTSVGFRSLKELEAFMGHDIRETTVPFDIDRKLTNEEIYEVLKYCKHDVMETFEVFVEMKHEFESHIQLVKEFNLPFDMVNKTKAQLSAEILGATPVKRDDEFDITLPNNIILGKYEHIKEHFLNWSEDAKISKDYSGIELETEICGVPHKLGVGGLHGAIGGYYGEGYYIMADVASYYPAGMIEYGFLSRNVVNPKKFKAIRDERIVMKAKKDPRQAPRKIVLNSTFGASKDRFNKLYDPLQANNLCIANQLFLIDLLEKLDCKCELIQSNTDGILCKLYNESDKEMFISICEEWCKRTRFELEYDEYIKVIQKDVNNYIIIDKNGNIKRKGAYVKKLNRLDYDMPIVNEAVVNYFTKNIDPKETIMNCNELIKFQIIKKVSRKFEWALKESFDKPMAYTANYEVKQGKKIKECSMEYQGEICYERVYRCFASTNDIDGTLYRKSVRKAKLDKVSGVPEHCFIDNDNVEHKVVDSKVDKNWYIKTAKKRIEDFLKN